MKHRGGVPKVFDKRPRSAETQTPSAAFIKKNLPIPEPPAKQTVRSGLSQLLRRPRSPLTGPGPTTAGRRRKTRKVKRRS